ncbi:hypothetical protein G6H54_000466 [Listeria monocytogenes]|nr:hypothetical protein [Listeria monocytogenes]
MEIHTWAVEIYVKYHAMNADIFYLTVQTFEKNRDKAIKSAKSKVITSLKKEQIEFNMIRLVWTDYLDCVEKSKYDCYVCLKEKGLSRSVIMKMMKLSYHEYLFFDNYYCGRTKRLTHQKYLYLKDFMDDEQIRRRFKIPKSEYTKFIQSHN